jgi:hypothetical protein
MIDTDNMSDAELATCVDAYVQRAINKAREREYNKQITIFIHASSFRRDDEYDIDHNLTLGGYGEESKVKSNNAINAVLQLVPAIQHVEVDKPTRVVKMLTAPVELKHEPEIYADFEPLSDPLDDDVPF